MSRRSKKNYDKDFIIRLAVDKYNHQFGKHINPDDMDARSIPVASSYSNGYEVFTALNDDAVRLQILMSVDADETRVDDFSLLSANEDQIVSVSEVAYVANGYLDIHRIWDRTLNLKELEVEDERSNTYLTEGGQILLNEDGSAFILDF